MYSDYPTYSLAVDAWVTWALHLPRTLWHMKAMTFSSVSGPGFPASYPCGALGLSPNDPGGEMATSLGLQGPLVLLSRYSLSSKALGETDGLLSALHSL